MLKIRLFVRRVRCVVVAGVFGMISAGALPGQGFTPVAPADALGVWNFNDAGEPQRAVDVMMGTPIQFEGNAAFSVAGGGRSGAAGDRALNFGTLGNSSARLTDAAFLALLNDRNVTGDRLSVVFWQRWSTAIASSSSVWFRSASATGTGRGFQAHLPWSDGTIFFDTSGCCAVPLNRLTTGSATNWQQWNHFALIKDGGAKQLWINGQLIASQASGAAALLGDWTELLLGRTVDSTTTNLKGMMDDLGIFSVALTAEQIAALAGGLDPHALVVAPAERAPVIGSLMPAAGAMFQPASSALGFAATTVAPNTLETEGIRMFLDGVEITGSLTIGGTATQRTVSSSMVLAANRVYSVRAEVSDQAGRVARRSWVFDTVDPATMPAYPALDLKTLAVAAAPLVVDGNPATFVETADEEGAFLELQLGRAVRARRIELVAPIEVALDGILNGARLQVFGLRDQLLYETTIHSVASGGTFWALLPPETDARWLRIVLPAGQTNGLGDHRLALADWRVMGDPSPEVGPLQLAAMGRVSQSSTNGANTAAMALNGNPASVSETQNVAGSHWQVSFDRPRVVRRVELMAPGSATSTRVGGLTLRLLDAAGNTLASDQAVHPGAGGVWSYDVPAGVGEVSAVWIGLVDDALNGYGDRVVSLAEVTVLTGENLARGKPSYMVRLVDTLPSPALANDGNPTTFTETTQQTVDGYWETDLGVEQLLHSVRVLAFDSGDHQRRLTNATLRLFDENHESVYAQRLGGTKAVFDISLPAAVKARYVRIGLENKIRTSATGGTEWWLRLREVEVFGGDLSGRGIIEFSATPTAIPAGGEATLAWQVKDLSGAVIHPGIGSVGGITTSGGAGSLMVSPAVTTEYLMVGESSEGPVTRGVTVTVDDQLLPVRISEFVASNRFSLTDGDGSEPDWIELHNPNAVAVDLTSHGLSDNPALPFKWIFPNGTQIPANGHLIVFASGRAGALDPAGNLHANFSLAAVGESVVLTGSDSGTIDAILNYPAQREDLAYGKGIDGNLGYFTPSPRGYALDAPLAGWLGPLVFSHSRGFFDAGFNLTISHPDPAAAILVSLDGREPVQPYSGPIAVGGSTVVRAVVRREGYHSSAVVTHSYLFHDSVMASPLMNATYTQGELSGRLRSGLGAIPTISLTVPVVPDDYNEREASVEVFLADGSPPKQVNAGLARFGGAWTEFVKKSYRVRFRSEYGAKKLEVPLFRGFDKGMPALESIDTLDLSAGNHDAAQRGFYMANRFVEDTMLEMGSLNPHGRYVHVYLNGVYWGQYNAHERLDDDFLAGYLGGSDDDYLVVRGNDNSGSNFVTGTPDPQTRASWETVRANRSSYLAVRDRLDVAHLIDFMLVWFYGNSESEFRCAGPVAPGTGFKFWLADADGFLRTSALTLDTTANTGPGGLFGALVAEGHPDFRMLLADRIHRHFFNNGALTPARNVARLNARMAEIQDSLIAECARWGYRTPTTWESAAQTIRTGLFPQRTGNLLALLRGRGFYPAVDAPVFGQHGGSVASGQVLSITAGSGTIYYTLDGSDPRLPGGGVSAGAVPAQVTTTTFVPFGSVWRFRDVGSLPASNWMAAGYDDGGWSVGVGPLGYGTGDEGTVVSFGSNGAAKHITTYFRRVFTVEDPALITRLDLDLVRDDGAVVYLNGTEIIRSNMPATGAIGFSTLASSTISGNAKLTVHRFTVPRELLVAGANVLAVEVHQAAANSGDLRFDLALTQTVSPSIVLNQNTWVNARLLSGTTWSALTSADFQVAYPLGSAGPYVMSGWSASALAGSAPPNMRFLQSDLPDPDLAVPMEMPWALGYDLTSRSRIVGLEDSGVGFINTGNPQEVAGAGFVGAAVVSLDTRGVQDVRVRWTGGTVIRNERDYGIRLQYRIGQGGPFLDVPGSGGQAVEYLRGMAGEAAVIGPVALPAVAEDQPLVELRWRYYYRSGSGTRPLLRLDDIQISAGPVVAEELAVVEAPAGAQAGRVAGPVVVQVLGRNGAAAGMFDGLVTVSISGAPGVLQGTITRPAVNGLATFDDLVFPVAGSYVIAASAEGLAGDVSAFPTRVLGLRELVMPGCIQGSSPVNGERVPHGSLLRIEGLLPSATYRYANQMVTEDDPADAAGAGNMIFVRGRGEMFVRTGESPRFLAGDLHVRHGEFTTGADGSFTGWFLLEPTGNPRFTPGNLLFTRLLLNDGSGGDVVHHALTSAAAAEVRAFGVGSGDGSAVFGEVVAAERDFIVFYTDEAGATMPLAAAPIEATGAMVTTNYAAFYQAEVSGRPGRWGALIPNGLVAGVRRFEVRDGVSGEVISVAAVPEGHGLTSGLAAGGVATGIRVPLGDGFARWQALRFPLVMLEWVGSAAGDPDGDGAGNLLEFVLGGDPWVADAGILPQMARVNGEWVFHFRRAAESISGTELVIQHGGDLVAWEDLAMDGAEVEVGPVVDGWQSVRARIPVPVVEGGGVFARLKVVVRE